LYVPLSMYDTLAPGTAWFSGRRWRWLNVIARLGPGRTIEEGNASARLIGDRLAEAYPDVNRGRTLAAIPLTQTAVNPNQYGTIARAGSVLLAIVAVVLLIACANLANLLLARAAGQAREVALRAALGASRVRIVRQLLTESLLLAAAGGIAGMATAFWIQQWLWASRPANLLRPAVELSLNADVLFFAVAISLATGLVFGLVPALQVSRVDVITTLKEAGRQPASPGRRRLRSALVVAEVALSVIALVASGLLVRSLQEAQRIDPGFDAGSLVRLNYNLRGGGYDAARARLFHERVMEILATTPGIRAAAVASRGPLSQGGGNTIQVAGQQPPPGTMGFLVQMGWVSPGYFQTLRIPIMSGRDFGSDDRPGGRLVGVINETMARRFWPDGNAVGQRFTSIGLPAPVEVAGIARDSKYVSIGEDPQPFFYLPLLQQDSQSAAPVTLLVSTHGSPADGLPAIRAAMNGLDPTIPLTNVITGPELLHVALWAPRMGATLVSAFGVLALLLAAVGIYGVMAYTVAQGRHEIGLRLALGATPRGIFTMIVCRGGLLAGTGALLGIAVALATAGALASLLYGVNPRDPVTFIAVPAGLILIALAACYIPARRAARLDPAATLRGG
jgi:predicted permease